MNEEIDESEFEEELKSLQKGLKREVNYARSERLVSDEEFINALKTMGEVFPQDDDANLHETSCDCANSGIWYQHQFKQAERTQIETGQVSTFYLERQSIIPEYTTGRIFVVESSTATGDRHTQVSKCVAVFAVNAELMLEFYDKNAWGKPYREGDDNWGPRLNAENYDSCPLAGVIDGNKITLMWPDNQPGEHFLVVDYEYDCNGQRG